MDQKIHEKEMGEEEVEEISKDVDRQIKKCERGE